MMEIGRRTLNISFLYYSLITICCIVVYYSSLNNGFFCWDDKTVALAPELRNFSLSGIINLFSSFHVGLYHPLTSLSFMFDYFLGNGSSFPFHLTNLILHTCNSILVFITVRKLSANDQVSILTGILFAVHPIHVESVTWITSRKDVLFSFFFLLSLISYINYFKGVKRGINYTLAFLFALFALLSKVQAVSLPIVFFLIDIYKGRNLTLKMIMDKIPFILICLIFGWINIISQKEYGYFSYGNPYTSIEKVIIVIYSISTYFLKSVVPYNLSVFYPFPFKSGDSIPMVTFLPPLFLIISFTLLIIIRWKNTKPALYSLLFFFANILVVATIGFNRDAVIAERYAYISSAGIFILIAIIGTTIINSYKALRPLVISFFICSIICLSFITITRNLLWNDSVALFKNALSIYSDSEIILNSLAAEEIEAGQFETSIQHLNMAIGISPKYSQAYYNRGIAFTKIRNFPAAINDFNTAIEQNPSYYEAYFSRGNAFMKSNDLISADDDFTYVIALNPNHFGSYQNRAIVRGNLDNFIGSIEDLNIAISLNPEFAASYYLRGIALFKTGSNGCEDLWRSYKLGYEEASKAIEHYCK